MLSDPHNYHGSLTCCIPDSCFIAKIVPVSIRMMHIVGFVIDKRLKYLLINNYWSQMTKNYKFPEKFLPDICTSSLSWVQTVLTFESRFRITREDSEEKIQIYAFLSEEEKKGLKLFCYYIWNKFWFFHSFVNTNLVWNFLYEEANIRVFPF